MLDPLVYRNLDYVPDNLAEATENIRLAVEGLGSTAEQLQHCNDEITKLQKDIKLSNEALDFLHKRIPKIKEFREKYEAKKAFWEAVKKSIERGKK